MPGPLLLVAVAAAAAAVLCGLWSKRQRHALPLPPGPPADPFLGHLRLMPSHNPHETFFEWSKQYGDVMYLDVLGKPVLILSSEDAATDLLDKRSANYSDRPRFPIYQRIGWRDIMAFLPYGTYYRKLRKMFGVPFDRAQVAAYKPIQEQEANALLMNVLRDPAALDTHVHRYSAAIIFEITYGHRVRSHDDEYFRMSEQFIRLLLDAGRPSLLDISEHFDKLPSWFPGAWYQRYIQDTAPFLHHMIDHPVAVVQKEMAAGTAQPSFVSHHIDELARQGKLTDETRHDVRMLAHQILGGGSETTWHTVMLFVACMLLNPDAQARAQAELDGVVGRGRLPDFTDRAALPYVGALVQETMRWNPVLPLGVPHRAVAEDEYRGWRVPAGATVLANAKAIAWDARRFHEPHRFKPERFLPAPAGAGEAFPVGAVFGWGRRICPGRFLADNSAWLAIARLLAAFDSPSTRLDSPPIATLTLPLICPSPQSRVVMENPQTYVAYRFEKSGAPLARVELPWADPQEGEVVVKVLASGVCATMVP
ncbi:hypothetical protein PHLGIDRAFT_131056 [Phlebiopsis gigantea 11061_1 CR5-6]|uniref:Cytochrome P450 n=1 Tax=Phlebiopsis gigantea (strain 11061_1 CR5-6) TaxID=745531 RepID=A0A0C3NBM7_PHLG1|nr:hypothetical protein PHLGIDRAFT_131056 [Phlebiopsis gigantea 11061_1 CR5-6]